MRKRTLGRTGLEITEVGYGAWGIGGNQWRGHTDDDALGALRHALAQGLNFIDTALAYNEGHSEKLIAQALKETGASAWVATKIPPKNRVWPAQPGIAIDEVFPADYIKECTETSLRNLSADTLDLQQFHVWNPEWLPRDEWKRAVEDLKREGKIRFFGVSINDHQPGTAIELCKTGLVDTVQVIFNIFDQSPLESLLPLAAELNVGVLARCPFDEGALTGAITPDSEFDPQEFRAMYFRGDRKQQVFDRVNALKADLEAHGLNEPLARTAIRFCLSAPAVSTVIPGMRKIRNVEANLAASEAGPLSKETLDVLKNHAWTKNFYS